MDLSGYMKRSRSSGMRVNDRARFCLNCSKQLDKESGHLFFQGFCSQNCKDDYLESIRSGKG
ncbi:MAG: hypothetical protein J4215_02470 [Candidatus Diapherotrites archaeon]|uniref:Uncharacterized protein n=1 Tax=Candidatus Iainarchaeum sp. TaxID=3101447 RepID=A0A8T4L4I7_9ARCH|nr:hypothetical protein [Candidatus Diapherotrites archaeon]